MHRKRNFSDYVESEMASFAVSGIIILMNRDGGNIVPKTCMLLTLTDVIMGPQNLKKYLTL